MYHFLSLGKGIFATPFVIAFICLYAATSPIYATFIGRL